MAAISENRGFLYSVCSVLLALSSRNSSRDRRGNNGLQVFPRWWSFCLMINARILLTKIRDASNFASR